MFLSTSNMRDRLKNFRLEYIELDENMPVIIPCFACRAIKPLILTLFENKG